MNKVSAIEKLNFKAALVSLVFLFFINIAYSQIPGNASTRNPLVNITLTCTGISPLGGANLHAKLDWTTDDPSVSGDFFVERFESTIWKSITQIRFTNVANYTYIDTISYPFCTKTSISYRIRFVADNTSISFSNTETKVDFADSNLPLDARNNIVSIVTYTDISGLIVSRPVIEWTHSRSNDIAAYRIDRSSITNPQYFPIKTIPADSTKYIDKDIIDICSKSYAYAVVALDKCGNPSPGTYGIPEKIQTIVLTLDPINPCDRKANLFWNKYNKMPGGLGGYKVYRDDNYTGPVQVFDIKDTTATTYSDSYSFQNGHTYTYKIVAYSKNGLYLSSSCSLGTKYQGSNLPDTVYISQVSVENNEYVKVDYFYEPKNTIVRLELQRSDSQSGPWISIDTLVAPAGNFLDQYGSFNDNTAQVRNQSYFYRLVVIDDCNSTPVSSVNTATSIFLQQEFSETENKIFWNTYTKWLKGVLSYDIYRIEGGIPGSMPIAVVSSTTNTFSESASVVAPGVEVCYWVVAHENTGNPYVSGANSKSNTCCIVKEPIFVMPTAFNPSSDKNNRLRPVTAYVDPQGFKMTVFDRWGQQLFETNDMDTGWDGLFEGKYAPAGLYSFIVSYKSIDGKEYLLRGTSLLIR